LIPNLRKKSPSKSILLFFDFDGTLAPIVRRPHLAVFSPKLKKEISYLSHKPRWTVAIISGRDLASLRKKVGIPHIIYSGNHGYEILFPGKKNQVHPSAKASQRLMFKLYHELTQKLKAVRGAWVENKRYSLSLHTRTLTPSQERRAKEFFFEVLRNVIRQKKIRVSSGKKVWEVRPPINWDKGKAVKYIWKKVDARGFPIYIGDDLTDEDAFKVLRKKGWGIRVGSKGRTHAHTSIKNIGQMPKLLRELKTL